MALLTVNGGIRATGDVTAFYSSDERLKENVWPIPEALKKLENLRGVSFDWRKDAEHLIGAFDGYFSRTGNHGVIAQELEKVLPEAVYEIEDFDDEMVKSIRYGNVVGLLVEAIKELKQEIETLKSK